MEFMKNKLPRGFTLVELLVVIAIIGILVALLLPAIQAAREAARRSQCMNNEKNIALAALAYHDAYGHFPISDDYDQYAPLKYDWNGAGWSSSGVADPKRSSRKLSGAGWITKVLPFLEETALYDIFKTRMDGTFDAGQTTEQWYRFKTGINFYSAAAPQIREASAIQPAVLMCPSDEGRGPRSDQWPYTESTDIGVTNPPWEVAVSHYKGNAGDFSFEGPDPPHDQPAGEQYPFNNFWSSGNRYRSTDAPGIFWRFSYWKGGVKLKNITDGTSHTFIIGEGGIANGRAAAWSSTGDWALTSMPINWQYETSPSCTGPNGLDLGKADCWSNMQGFRSFHPGGAMFAFVDGSVSFINEQIEHLTYRALSTKADDEVVGEY